MAKATCPFCGQYLSTKEESKVYKGKKYHLQCFSKVLDDMESGSTEVEELHKYICKVLDIPTITPYIIQQIEGYINQKGYSISGIKGTLYYFFELCGKTKSEETKGIGIVEYVYEEARQFFVQMKIANEHNNKFITEQAKLPITANNVRIRKPKGSVSKIDISSIV